MEKMAEDWKERYLQLWKKTTKKQRYLMFGILGLVIAAIIAGSYFYGSKPDLVPLFTNMETKDAGEVAAKLKESKISDLSSSTSLLTRAINSPSHTSGGLWELSTMKPW